MEILTLIVLLAGILLRLLHLFQMNSLHEPFRLGGLFIAFAEQISINGFRIPVTIPYYSQDGIPFAYPPLGFYLEAILLKLAPHSQIFIANILPPAISAIALVGVMVLLRRMFPHDPKFVLAGTFAYAFLPPAFSNQIEAAGLAESLGSLALVVFFYTLFQYRNISCIKHSLWVGLGLGLCVLSSPGSAIGAALVSILFGLEILLKHKFNSRIFLELLLAAITGLVISAPFWASVLINHGRGFFITPVIGQYNSQSGKQGYLLATILQLLNFQLVQDGSYFFWNLFIFLGFLWVVIHGEFSLPLAFLGLFSIPRENVWLTALPASILFAYGITRVILPLIQPLTQFRNLANRISLTTLLVFFCSWMTIGSFGLNLALLEDQQWKISATQINLIEQAGQQIPENASVIVIGNDAIHEWAPYLLKREVINTKFGLEWQPAELEMTDKLNESISEAQSWDDVLQAVTHSTRLQRVYVLSSSKKLLTRLSKESTVPYTLKMETPEIQLSLLGAP